MTDQATRPEGQEAEIARVVVTELQRQGYDTYEEVQGGRGASRADIVAVRGPLVGVVECKTSLSLKLLDQVTDWLGLAHFIVAAAVCRRPPLSAHRYLKSNGIGLWTIKSEGIDERIAPKLHRAADVRRLRSTLCEHHRSGEFARAGSVGGGYYTPFRSTVMSLTRLVKSQPGITLREAMSQIDHHYASAGSARNAIPALVRKGVIQGIRVDGGRPVRLWPHDEAISSDGLRKGTQ